MVQKNMTAYSDKRFKSMFGLFNKLSKNDVDSITTAEANRIQAAIKVAEDETAAALAKIKEEARFTVDNLREIASEQPEMLRPLMLAYE